MRASRLQCSSSWQWHCSEIVWTTTGLSDDKLCSSPEYDACHEYTPGSRVTDSESATFPSTTGTVSVSTTSPSDEVTVYVTVPLADELICQVGHIGPGFDHTLRALELLATQVAPALGWRPRTG